MIEEFNAYLLGGGIGSLAAAAFMIRDGGLPGENVFILEANSILGGSLDGAGNARDGYSLRGGRMLTTDNYECTWDLYKSIPSLTTPGKAVFDETIEFNMQIDRRIPPISTHDKSPVVQFEALVKAFK
jgi:oleate hydratase